MRYAYLGEQRLARLDPVDVGPRTAPVTKTGAAVTLSNNRDTNTPNAAATLAIRFAHAWYSPTGIAALAAIVFAYLLLLIANGRTTRPAFALRVGTVAISMTLVTFAGLGVQACSSDRASHTPSFREQSVEITAVPDSAEFYLADAQQSPLAVVSKVASVVSRTALHPFGHVRFQTGKAGDPWGFVGNEEDRGSGVSDFHARPYRPELGVFLAVDPVALFSPDKVVGCPQRVLAYVYAGAQPTTAVDRDGLTLQLVGSRKDQVMLLGLLSQISGEPLVLDRYGTVTVGSGPPVSGHDFGAQLVRELIASEQTVVIQPVVGKTPVRYAETNPTSPEDVVDHKPSGATIFFDQRKNMSGAMLRLGDPSALTVTEIRTF